MHIEQLFLDVYIIGLDRYWHLVSANTIGGGAYSAPPNLLAGFRGEGQDGRAGRNGEGRRGEGWGMEG